MGIARATMEVFPDVGARRLRLVRPFTGKSNYSSNCASDGVCPGYRSAATVWHYRSP
jgi:hypothetical protein